MLFEIICYTTMSQVCWLIVGRKTSARMNVIRVDQTEAVELQKQKFQFYFEESRAVYFVGDGQCRRLRMSIN